MSGRARKRSRANAAADAGQEEGAAQAGQAQQQGGASGKRRPGTQGPRQWVE